MSNEGLEGLPLEDLPKVSDLIDQIMKVKDPSTVGLRKIIKQKVDATEDFPLKNFAFGELNQKKEEGCEPESPVFTDQELDIIKLEKEIITLKEQLKGNAEAVEVARKEGFEQGHSEGVTEGKEVARQEYEKIKEEYCNDVEHRIQTLLTEIKTFQSDFYFDAHGEILPLVKKIVSKIIRHEITVSDDIIIGVLKNTLRHIADKSKLIIRVATDDLENVLNKKNMWNSLSERIENLVIEDDSRITRGGCIIESNTGAVDSKIETAENEIFTILEREWESIISSPNSNSL